MGPNRRPQELIAEENDRTGQTLDLNFLGHGNTNARSRKESVKTFPLAKNVRIVENVKPDYQFNPTGTVSQVGNSEPRTFLGRGQQGKDWPGPPHTPTNREEITGQNDFGKNQKEKTGNIIGPHHTLNPETVGDTDYEMTPPTDPSEDLPLNFKNVPQNEFLLENLFTDKNLLIKTISELKVERKNTVVNLSSRSLTEPEKDLLQKGLNFCPTPGEPILSEIHSDLEKFHDNLRWKQHFHNQPPTENETERNFLTSKALRRETTKRPPPGSSHLETFATLNEIQLTKSRIISPKQKNLSAEEKSAIKGLFNDKSITIKPADKGGATVIQNTKDYITEAERQLKDKRFYKEIPNDLTHIHTHTINQYLNGLHKAGEISARVKHRLIGGATKAPQIYFLPKIHKEKDSPPGRPVVSANSCATEKVSALVDFFTKPIVPHIPSYLKDTGHFLETIRGLNGTLPPQTLLCTLDVTSLYTNIPNEEGRRAMASWLSKFRPQRLVPNNQPSNTTLLSLLRMVLEMNNFQFNGKNYLQVGGTAMGTRVAPTLANLFMGYFEEKFVYTQKFQPKLWVRFIDDIFVIWTHGAEKLHSFIANLNNAHHSIKFTAEISAERLPFLDTMVILGGEGDIFTDLYTKPTDANNFLHFDSAHPTHCKKGIPYGQFLRLRRICDKDEDFRKHALNKAAHFRERGYPLDLIAEACIRAWDSKQKGRDPNNQDKTDPKNKLNILVTTFHPTFNDLSKIVKGNWDILARSARTKPIFDSTLILSLRRPPNLKSQLVRARTDFHPDQSKHPSAISGRTYNICYNDDCRYCPKLNTDGKITSKTTGRDYTSKTNVSCQSSNLVYCLSCKACGTQYVGQTKRRLMDRFQDHFYKIDKNVQNSDIGRHFNSPGHRGLLDVEIHIVDFIHCAPESENARKLRFGIEKNWIFRLRTLIPEGLNLIDAPIYN